VALLTPVPTLTLTPSAPLAGMYPEVRGEGFLPNTWTRLSMDGVGTSRSWRTTTSGSFVTGPPALTKAAGTHQVLIVQQYVKGVWVEPPGTRLEFDVASPPPPPPPPPPPVITGTALPSSIANATGNVDAQLTDWLMSLPDNATALLGSAKLAIAKQVDLQGRGPLRVEGRRRRSAASTARRSASCGFRTARTASNGAVERSPEPTRTPAVVRPRRTSTTTPSTSGVSSAST
jgi:hypothetical protein